MIQILFFGRIADLMRVRKMHYDPGAIRISLYNLRATLAETAGVDQVLMRSDVQMSVNQIVVKEDIYLKAGDEVAFFSVFSGG